MDRQKLIEDTIKVNAINSDGQVFDRGKYNSHPLNPSSLLTVVKLNLNMFLRFAQYRASLPLRK